MDSNNGRSNAGAGGGVRSCAEHSAKLPDSLRLYFPFYFADWSTSERVKLMTHATKGIYLDLIIHQWIEGSVPASPDLLARVIGASNDAFDLAWIELKGCFDLVCEECGRRLNRRAHEERNAKLEQLLTLSERGRRARSFQLAGNAPATRRQQAGSSDQIRAEQKEDKRDIGHLTLTPSPTGTLAGSRRPMRVPGGFEEFWTAWPRKVAKAAARRAYTALDPDRPLLERMLASIRAWSTTEQWMTGYIANPATWLHGRRWEDELPAPPKTRDQLEYEAAKQKSKARLAKEQADWNARMNLEVENA